MGLTSRKDRKAGHCDLQVIRTGKGATPHACVTPLLQVYKQGFYRFWVLLYFVGNRETCPFSSHQGSFGTSLPQGPVLLWGGGPGLHPPAGGK